MKCALEHAPLIREFEFLRRAGTDAAVALNVPVDAPWTVTLTATSSRCSLVSDLANREGDRRAGVFPVSLKLQDVVRTLDEPLTFERHDRDLLMSWSTGDCKTLAPYLWQSTPFVLGALVSQVEIDPSAFLTMMAKLRFCFPPASEMRIPGLKFTCSSTLEVISTNGTALGFMTRPMDRPSVGSFVLSVSSCEDIIALLRENRSEPLALHFHTHHLRAVCGHRTYITSYGTSGVPFPELARLFVEPSIRADLAVGPAKQALRRATAACTYDANESFRVRIALLPGAIRMETLESSEEIGTYGGDPISFIVNSKMLSGVLDAISTDTVTLLGRDARAPWLFQSTEEDHPDRFILAPMSAL